MRAETAVGLSFFVDDIGGRRYAGHNVDRNGFKAYLSLCPSTHTASLPDFNTDMYSGSASRSSRREKPLISNEAGRRVIFKLLEIADLLVLVEIQILLRIFQEMLEPTTRLNTKPPVTSPHES